MQSPAMPNIDQVKAANCHGQSEPSRVSSVRTLEALPHQSSRADYSPSVWAHPGMPEYGPSRNL